MSDEVTIIQRPARFSLDELARRAEPHLRAAGARRAIAFGSWARGTADAFSDLDLVVVLETDLPRLERGSLLADLVEALPIGVDLFVFTPAEFERGLEDGYGIFEAIQREGVVIYAGAGD